MAPGEGRSDVPTMPRSLRIPEDLWLAAVINTRNEGTTVTAAKAIKWRTSKHERYEGRAESRTL